MRIGERPVGPGEPCLIIAEVAQAHDGSLGSAHAYIEVAAREGADAVKFQTHIAAAESTPGEPWRVNFSPQDETRFDYWRRMEFTEEQWAGLARHARDCGLIFLSTPFSDRAVDLLTRLEVRAWKVASGEVGSSQLLARMAQTGKPVLLSSGMSSWAELDAAVQQVREHDGDVAVFQTTTSYPCPPEKVGLNVMAEIRERYGCPVGLSDHSGTTHAGIAAAALGANLLEVHVVFSKDCFGPDTTSSLTPAQLGDLVAGVRYVETILHNPVDKDEMAEGMESLRRTFGKSVVSAMALESGTVLGPEHLAFKKPGTGIPAAHAEQVVGRRLSRAVAADHLLSEDDLA